MNHDLLPNIEFIDKLIARITTLQDACDHDAADEFVIDMIDDGGYYVQNLTQIRDALERHLGEN